LDLVPIHRGNLVARVKLLMPSGMILACNVLRSKKDPENVFVLPVGERLHNGSHAPIVDFVKPDLRDAWQAVALAALRPRWAELTQPQATAKDREVGDYAAF
jgi:hypothetical protein